MAKHTVAFKRKAVDILHDFKLKGTLNIKDKDGDVVQVKNVRELVKVLNCSSQSLYKWVKLYSIENTGDNDVSDDDVSDDFFDSEIESQIVKGDGEWFGNEKTTGEKVIFNQRYYGWFAGMLGIKGYGNMLVPQLKLVIGNELIKQSGLIDMNKIKRELSKNGDGL